MLKQSLHYMVISTIAFALLNTFVKYLSHFDVYEIVFFRALGSLVFTFIYIGRHKLNPFGNQKLLLVIRSLVGLTSMILFFMSLKYLPVGSAVSLRYIAPIFAAIFALFLLKEEIKLIQWLFFGLAFIGVLMLKGFDSEVGGSGFIYAMISAFFSGLVYIIIRKIGNKDHPVIVVNYFMLISLIIAGVISIFNWTTPVGIEWLLLLSLGIFGYFGQLYMTKALQVSETNKVAPLKYMEVIFTMIIGLVWFGDTYTTLGLFGVLIIILALTLNNLVIS